MLFFLKFVAIIGIAAFFGMRLFKTTTSTTPSGRAVTSRSFHLPGLFTGLGAVAAAMVLFSSFGTVGAGQRGVVLRWGATTGRVVQPGLYVVTPMIEDVHPMNVQVQKETAAGASAVSHDLQQVETTVALNYYVSPEAVSILYAKVGDDYKSRIVDPAIQEAVKATTARFTAEDLIAKRNEVKEMLAGELRERLATHNIAVDAVSITDFQFTKEFTEAVEAKVTAQQLALKAQNNLQQVKFEADQTVAKAQADAEAIRIQAQAITQQGGREYVDLQAIKKWDGALPQNMYGSAPVPFINLPAQR